MSKEKCEELLPTAEIIAGPATFIGGLAIEHFFNIPGASLVGLIAGTVLYFDGMRRPQ